MFSIVKPPFGTGNFKELENLPQIPGMALNVFSSPPNNLGNAGTLYQLSKQELKQTFLKQRATNLDGDVVNEHKNQPIGWFPEKDNAKLLEECASSSPSDEIRLTEESDKYLTDLWRENNEAFSKKYRLSIPSDLFFASTIPLMDCRITVENHPKEKGPLAFRMLIHDDYRERIANADECDAVTVGVIILDVCGADILIPVDVMKGIDCMLFTDHLGYFNLPAETRKDMSSGITVRDVGNIGLDCLAAWYGIQIALLHPLTKEVFSEPKLFKNNDKSVKKLPPDRQRKLKYIRTHYIEADKIDSALYMHPAVLEIAGGGGDGLGSDVDKKRRSFKRKTFVWRVIGHWRLKGTPKQKFIQPTWKGPLRHLKQNLDEMPERVIAQVSN
ncbi:MAG: hypothetical protein LBG64_02730 [Pseudomonadales bacterium]|jgi:hypothetical protein|nr:hypothetical protein [Pseudomonadales bacterium]